MHAKSKSSSKTLFQLKKEVTPSKGPRIFNVWHCYVGVCDTYPPYLFVQTGFCTFHPSTHSFKAGSFFLLDLGFQINKNEEEQEENGKRCG